MQRVRFGMDKQLLHPKRTSMLSTPKFTFTRKLPIKIIRFSPGEYIKGKWVDGSNQEIELEGNVQPMRGHELLTLPESDRTKDVIKVYTVESLKTLDERTKTKADLVIWNDLVYQIVKTMTYQMGVLNHTKSIAVRMPLTPEDYGSYNDSP